MQSHEQHGVFISATTKTPQGWGNTGLSFPLLCRDGETHPIHPLDQRRDDLRAFTTICFPSPVTTFPALHSAKLPAPGWHGQEKALVLKLSLPVKGTPH